MPQLTPHTSSLDDAPGKRLQFSTANAISAVQQATRIKCATINLHILYPSSYFVISTRTIATVPRTLSDTDATAHCAAHTCKYIFDVGPFEMSRSSRVCAVVYFCSVSSVADVEEECVCLCVLAHIKHARGAFVMLTNAIRPIFGLASKPASRRAIVRQHVCRLLRTRYNMLICV